VDDLVFCVPSGNFGNLTAGIYAWKWGLPVDGFIAATNANDVVPQYLLKGRYEPKASVSTYSNAMDVGNPSNFERMMDLFSSNWDHARSMIHGEVVTDEETARIMKDVLENHGYLLCPHTAVGYEAARRYQQRHEGENETVVVLATAHPGKFVEVVEMVSGQKPSLPPELSSLMEKKKMAKVMGNTLTELKEYLLGQFQL